MRYLCLLALLAIGWTNAPVRELNLAKSYGDSAEIFDQSIVPGSVTNGIGQFLLGTVDACRQRAAKAGKSPQSIGSMGGRWLEWATVVALLEHKLSPAYLHAEFSTVPHNFNDVMVWSQEHGPIIISCKTSLRERYKQADLEAVALRQHYPKAKFFLLTLDADKQHLANIRKKIAGKELLALQAIYDEANADKLFAFLKTLTLTNPPPEVLRSGTLIR